MRATLRATRKCRTRLERRSGIERAAWVVALLVPLFGCTVGPDYVRPAVESPQSWRVDYEAAADISNTRWWEQFDDPALNELIDIALSENKDVRIAAARIEEFAARVDTFRSGFFPQLDYDGEASRNRASRESFGGVPMGDRTYNTYVAA